MAKSGKFLTISSPCQPNINSEPKEYRMTVHLFGATSLPGCENFVLKKVTSEDHQCGTKAADFMWNNF